MSTPFGDELKRARTSVRLSQNKLAERADCDHSYASRLESGSRMPTREMVDRLAVAMRLAPREHDRLLAAAGFLPARVDALLGDEPECGALLGYLTNPDVPDWQRQAVRAAIRELLVAVNGGMTA